MNKILIVCSLFIINSIVLKAQLSGSIKDEFGAALPAASIYIKGTSIGTNSNSNGKYTLNIPKGRSEVVFQYIGYKQRIETVTNNGKEIILDVVLKEQEFDLSEVEIKSGGEDPAYRIIRAAIKKRSYYKDLIKNYSCNVYIKGNQKILKIPKEIFGEKTGDLEGILDSNGQGIIYLSESVSRFNFKETGTIKEELISSKTSGNSRGFSFNRARELQFSLYQPSINFLRDIISPIGPGALLYYKYVLEGSYFDKEGNEINKIRVIPRNDSDPVFRGYIYIYENAWSIHSAQLAVTGKSINQEILDTLWLRQQYIPGPEKDQWILQSQNLDFGVNIIGVKLKGFFTAVYSDYELNKTFPEGFFSNEVLVIEKESNKKSDAYWDTLRPIPLLKEEVKDYTKKDSLQLIWDSKTYQDSMDKVGNKFEINNLFLGYTYRNSYKRTSLSFGSPLSTIEFDPVKGFFASLKVQYLKYFDENRTSWFKVAPEITYGLAETKLRASIDMDYQFSRNNYTKIGLSGGIKTVQFNERNPISSLVNQIYNLWEKVNYLKQYEKTFISVDYSQYILPGLKFSVSGEMAKRNILENHTNYSFQKKAKAYPPNYPGDTLPVNFSNHIANTVGIGFSFWPGQKYVSYPDFRIYLSSKYPIFSFNYKATQVNYYTGSEKSDYLLHTLRAGINYSFSPRFIGNTSLSIFAGKTFGAREVEIMDYIHFNGNQTLINSPRGSMNSYKLLPYYDHSILDGYIEGHLEHNFKGFFLGKIPLIKELKFEEVTGINYLIQENDFRYLEYSIGLSNIGWSIFRLFRVEYTWAFENNRSLRQGLTIGIGL